MASEALQALGAARDSLGECVLWCAREQRLWWCDIDAGLIHCAAADGSAHERFQMPERVGSFALCETPGRLLVGLASGIALYELATRRLGPLVAVEPELASTRINDGRCDRQGRFVFGTYNEARDGAAIGHFYRVSGGETLSVERLPLPAVTVANGIAFSRDGSRLYCADSAARRIWAADYAASGALGPAALFVELPPGQGFPDGSTVDADDCLWNARWEAGCVVRHEPSGREIGRWPLPARRVTCPAFGGPQLATLFVTSARIGLGEQALREQPQAGALFAGAVGVRGIAEPRYAA